MGTNLLNFIEYWAKSAQKMQEKIENLFLESCICPSDLRPLAPWTDFAFGRLLAAFFAKSATTLDIFVFFF
jgi:hypothetical protein